MPAGPRNWLVDRGQTSDEPAMEQTGSGATRRTISSVSVQALDWRTVNRSVAVTEESRAVVIKEDGSSMVAEPLTTLQVVEAIG